MDALFLKEQVLSDMLEEEEFHKVFLNSIERVQSRKISDLFLDTLEKDTLQISEVLKICTELCQVLGKLGNYKRERFKRKFSAHRFFCYLLRKPVVLDPQSKAQEDIRALARTLSTDLGKVGYSSIEKTLFTVQTVGYIAEITQNKDAEIESILGMAEMLQHKDVPPKQEYLEYVVSGLGKYMETPRLVEALREKADTPWGYDKNNSAYRVLVSILAQAVCPSEYFQKRNIPLEKISPFLLSNTTIEDLAPALVCTRATAEAPAPKPESAPAPERFFRCAHGWCQRTIHKEYSRYLSIHGIRISIEIDKLVQETVQGRKKHTDTFFHALVHARKYQTLEALKYVVGTLKKIERKKTQEKEKEDVQRLFSVLKHFQLTPEMEEYVLGTAKAVCTNSTLGKKILVLNILYHIQSLPKIGFAVALLSHTIFQQEKSTYTRTAVHLVTGQHRSTLEESKELIFDHFLVKLGESTDAVLESLHRIYRRKSVREFIDGEKMLLIPRLWKKEEVGAYYKDAPENSIFYLVYLHERSRSMLGTQQYAQLRSAIEANAADALCVIYTAVHRPEELFLCCKTDTAKLLKESSLMCILFTARRVLEEKVVLQKNCPFLLLTRLVCAHPAAKKALNAENAMQELVSFLIYTENITGSPQCRCRTECRKKEFWSVLLSLLDTNRLIQYKYMVAADLEAEQRKDIEKRTGEDGSLHLDGAWGLEDVLRCVSPYLRLAPFFVRLTLGKIFSSLFSTPAETLLSLAHTYWAECRVLIVHMFHLYIDERCPRAFRSLSLFGMLCIDALEESNGASGSIHQFSKQNTLASLENKSPEQTAEMFIENILVPMYYDTLSDMVLYIIQELLKAYPALGLSTAQAQFLDRLKYSKYVLETAGEDVTETECFSKYSTSQAYRRGVSHKEFLLGALTRLCILYGHAQGTCPILKNLMWTIDALMKKKLSERHTTALLQFYLCVIMQELKSTHREAVEEIFAPVFRDARQSALVDKDVLRTIAHSSLCVPGIFAHESLMLCSTHLQDRHYAVWLLENQLGTTADVQKRDAILTDLQQNYLHLNEKDMVFGINTKIHSLMPVNLAAELEINNEHANLHYINREILEKKEEEREKHAKYRHLAERLREEKSVEHALHEMEHAIKQWADTVPPHALCETFEETKSFITDLHVLQDCRLLRERPLPEALDAVSARRDSAQTFEALRLSCIHKHLLGVLPCTAETEAAKKNGVLSGVRIARKSGQHELSEKFMIALIIAEDGRVFYEKALLHMCKGQKSLAKQALNRLLTHLPRNGETEDVKRALLLRTEIEESEDTYKKALQQISTSEKLYFGYGKYLEKKSPRQAFKMFCRALAVGREKAPEIVPKLIHYITETEHTNKAIQGHLQECAADLKKVVQETDPSVFRAHYAQIIARLSHKHGAVEEVLSLLTHKLLEAYPGEALWKSLSILKNTAFPSKSNTLSALIESASYATKTLFMNLQDLAQSFIKISMQSAEGSLVSLSSLMGGPLVVKPGVPAPCGDFSTEILSIEDQAFVFKTLQKPKKIKVLLKNGVFKSFLCKGRDDLRKDAKFIGLTLLLSSLFKTDDVCRGYAIRTYSVVPITSQTGVIEYLENTESLKSICGGLYSARSICTRSIVSKHLNGSKKCGAEFSSILGEIPPVFSEYFRSRFASPIRWLQARKAYTTTYAVMDAVGWIMGLGDRHADNILFDGGTGETVHVDLNCIFDKAHTLAIPETVPFRLTQNIVDAFGPTKEEGQYRLTLERMLRFLLGNKDIIMANLLGFVHDPLGEWTGRSNTKTAIQVIQKIQEKLDFDDELAKATLLIEKATSPKNLAEMYVGWCSYI
ncbi:serine/threonine-protein kinase ATR [Nematocida sp. AWRm77]|nr:serine/threonine-protein kinase ATR [Nematocida sp. AWRm77]